MEHTQINLVSHASPPKRQNTIWHLTTDILMGIILSFFLLHPVHWAVNEMLMSIPFSQEYIRSMNGNGISPTTFVQLMKEKREGFQNIEDFMLTAQDNVRHIPDTITSVSDIKHIYISDNPIESLPESIGSMTQLESIYVINGRLTTLPESIGNLQNLTELVIIGNRLKTLPISVFNLRNLETLNLDYNAIESFPQSLLNFPKLTVLGLTSNKFPRVPSPFPPELGRVFLGNNPIPLDTLNTYPPLHDAWRMYY